MGTVDMVGSMGLTFFCNRFVELLFEFERKGAENDTLVTICNETASSLESVSRLEEGGTRIGDQMALFGTDEDIRCFEQVVAARKEDERSFLNTLAREIRYVAHGDDLGQRKANAKRLREFFDELGDVCVCVTRDRMRDSVTEAI